MKKFTCIFLCLVLIFSAAPSLALAAPAEGLEKAILTAKGRIDIPADYSDFQSYFYTQGSITVYDLSWQRPYTDDYSEIGAISVSITDRGDIISYYKSSRNSNNYYDSYGISKLSDKDFLDKAKAFIKKINPEWIKELNFDNKSSSGSIYDNTVYVSSERLVNGLPFCGNSADIYINKYTGEVTSFYADWTYYKSIQPVSEAMTAEAAGKYIFSASPLELKYESAAESENAVLIYEPADKSIIIDAKTGDELTYSDDYGYKLRSAGGTASYAENAAADKAPTVPKLTEAELKEVSDMSGLMSEDDAEKAAKKLTNTGLSSYTLQSVSYGKVKKDSAEKIYIYVSLTSVSEADGYKYANVVFDAKTGELVSLSSQPSYRDEEVYDSESRMQKAKTFISAYASDLKNNVTAETPEYSGAGFTFVRTVNGLKYAKNYIYVNVDPFTGYVTGFNKSWNGNMRFEEKSGAITASAAEKLIFEKTGVKLAYINLAGNNYSEPDIRLAYTFGDGPMLVGAKSGKLLDYSLNEYTEGEASNGFTDISGHYAEKAITELLRNNVLSDADKAFRPNDLITQKEALGILMGIKNGGIIIYAGNNYEYLYKGAINEGLIAEKEKNPNGLVEKEYAAKYILSAFGYSKAAEISGIYKCDYKDSASIAPSLTGYIAIADGLDIISPDSAGNIAPQAKLTRAEFAVMLYNFFK